MWDTSSIQCHTVKEYQAEIKRLNNIILRLKQRIFFLEEITGYVTLDKDDPVKKNIELRVKCSFSSKLCFL
jgi:hypothetical protein